MAKTNTTVSASNVDPLVAGIEKLREVSKSLDGINALCQDIALLSARRLLTGVEKYFNAHKKDVKDGKLDAEEYCVPTQEIPELSYIVDVCSSSGYKVFLRKAFRGFFTQYLGITFKSDGTPKAQSLPVGHFRKALSKLEKLQANNQFPILIEENSERVKEPSKKQPKSARQMIDDLANKFEKDMEKDHLIEGSGEFLSILRFVRENPELMAFVKKNEIQLRALSQDPAKWERAQCAVQTKQAA